MAIVKPKSSRYFHVVLYERGKHRWISTGSDDILVAKAMEVELLKSIRAAKANAKKERIKDFVEQAAGTALAWGLDINAAWLAYKKLPKAAERTERTLASKRGIWDAFAKWLKAERPGYNRLD